MAAWWVGRAAGVLLLLIVPLAVWAHRKDQADLLRRKREEEEEKTQEKGGEVSGQADTTSRGREE